MPWLIFKTYINSFQMCHSTSTITLSNTFFSEGPPLGHSVLLLYESFLSRPAARLFQGILFATFMSWSHNFSLILDFPFLFFLSLFHLFEYFIRASLLEAGIQSISITYRVDWLLCWWMLSIYWYEGSIEGTRSPSCGTLGPFLNVLIFYFLIWKCS